MSKMIPVSHLWSYFHLYFYLYVARPIISGALTRSQRISLNHITLVYMKSIYFFPGILFSFCHNTKCPFFFLIVAAFIRAVICWDCLWIPQVIHTKIQNQTSDFIIDLYATIYYLPCAPPAFLDGVYLPPCPTLPSVTASAQYPTDTGIAFFSSFFFFLFTANQTPWFQLHMETFFYQYIIKVSNICLYYSSIVSLLFLNITYFAMYRTGFDCKCCILKYQKYCRHVYLMTTHTR